MSNQGLNAREFSARIGVQPSSISHILSGRNKPSIELIEKIANAFPDFDLQHFITGRTIEKTEFEVEATRHSATETSQEEEKTLEKVILLYTDGSFAEYRSLDGLDKK